MTTLTNRRCSHSLAIQLVQHVRRQLIGVAPEDKVDCLHTFSELLSNVLQDAYDDADAAGVYPPKPEDE